MDTLLFIQYTCKSSLSSSGPARNCLRQLLLFQFFLYVLLYRSLHQLSTFIFSFLPRRLCPHAQQFLVFLFLYLQNIIPFPFLLIKEDCPIQALFHFITISKSVAFSVILFRTSSRLNISKPVIPFRRVHVSHAYNTAFHESFPHLHVLSTPKQVLLFIKVFFSHGNSCF